MLDSGIWRLSAHAAGRAQARASRTVEAIEAQRLVRKTCPFCKTGYAPTKEQMMEVNLTPEVVKDRQFYYGEGCDKCNNLGFKGRTGLYELLIMNDDIRDMVSRGGSTDSIRQYTPPPAPAADPNAAAPAADPAHPAVGVPVPVENPDPAMIPAG